MITKAISAADYNNWTMYKEIFLIDTVNGQPVEMGYGIMENHCFNDKGSVFIIFYYTGNMYYESLANMIGEDGNYVQFASSENFNIGTEAVIVGKYPESNDTFQKFRGTVKLLTPVEASLYPHLQSELLAYPDIEAVLLYAGDICILQRTEGKGSRYIIPEYKAIEGNDREEMERTLFDDFLIYNHSFDH